MINISLLLRRWKSKKHRINRINKDGSKTPLTQSLHDQYRRQNREHNFKSYMNAAGIFADQKTLQDAQSWINSKHYRGKKKITDKMVKSHIDWVYFDNVNELAKAWGVPYDSRNKRFLKEKAKIKKISKELAREQLKNDFAMYQPIQDLPQGLTAEKIDAIIAKERKRLIYKAAPKKDEKK